MKRMWTIAVIVSLLLVSPALYAGPSGLQEPTPVQDSVAWAQSFLAQIIAFIDGETDSEETPAPSGPEQEPSSEPDIDPGSGETHPIVEPVG